MTSQGARGREARENEGEEAGLACDASGGVLRGPAARVAYV
jgi:hypothetical protein